MAEEQTIGDCCVAMNPCDATCMLENVMVKMVSGNFVTTYNVGNEQYGFRRPTMTEVRDLIDYFERKCKALATGGRRRRAKVCFVFDDTSCGACQQPSCSGRCR